MTTAPELAGWVFQGESAAAERLRVQVGRMARHFRTALVIGEAGSGKSEVARALYAGSQARGEMVACGAAEVGDAELEAARGGLLYLTGLGAVGLERQAELLGRLKQMMKSETRLVCAAESCLRGMVAAGRLRGDLYARVGTIEIKVAPLRERLEDLEVLGVRCSAEALEMLKGHRWPGNLVELRGVLEFGAARAGEGSIGVEHLPELVSAAGAAEEGEVRLEAVMRRHVVEVLERCSGNKLRAAEMLGISRSTLYRMLDGVAA